ncbi:MAG: MATE family efflux transporter [Bacillota bacterium]
MIRGPNGESGARLPKDADSGLIRRRIMGLAWPVVAEQALGTITHIIDMAMVGRLGATAIAAVGISLQPFMLAFALFGAVAMGTTAVVARDMGADRPRDASNALRQSLFLAMVLAILLGVLGYLFAPGIINLMGPEPDVLALGVGYVRWILPGMAFMLAAFMITGALRGAGDTMTPMKVNVVINVINPVLNYILIFGHLGFPAMGVNGAALATSLARGAGGIILLALVFSGRTVLTLQTAKLFHLDLNMIRRILKVGMPAAIEQSVTRLGQLLFVRVVANLGTMAYAAHTIAINAESISYMPAFGFATASTAMVGQNLGAKNPAMAERSGWEAWKLAAVAMGVMMVVLLSIPELLMRIYTTDMEVISMGRDLLRVVAFAQIPMATFFVLAGGLRGAGDTRTMLYISAASIWLVRLTLAQVFVNVLGKGITWVWAAMVADWFVRSALAAWRFRSGRWKDIEV